MCCLPGLGPRELFDFSGQRARAPVRSRPGVEEDRYAIHSVPLARVRPAPVLQLEPLRQLAPPRGLSESSCFSCKKKRELSAAPSAPKRLCCSMVSTSGVANERAAPATQKATCGGRDVLPAADRACRAVANSSHGERRGRRSLDGKPPGRSRLAQRTLRAEQRRGRTSPSESCREGR